MFGRRLRRIGPAILGAAVFSAAWLLMFALNGHPVEAWAVTIITVYAIWLAVVNLMMLGVTLYTEYISRRLDVVSARLGITPVGHGRHSARAVVVANCFVLAILALSQSVSVVIANLVLAISEFVALPSAVLQVAVALGVLSIVFVAFVVMSALVVLSRAESIADEKAAERHRRVASFVEWWGARKQWAWVRAAVL